MKLRIRRRARKELLNIDDDATFFALVKAMLDLGRTLDPEDMTRSKGRVASTVSEWAVTGVCSTRSIGSAASWSSKP